MYNVIVVALMVVLPVGSVMSDYLSAPDADLMALVGKWFVFWCVGIRLLTAGIRQLLQPEFTARDIFGITDPSAVRIVSELGVSNLAIGIVGSASLYVADWMLPAAVYGVVFYGLAALRHLRNRHRTTMESVATYTDLWAAVVLGVFLVGTYAGLA